MKMLVWCSVIGTGAVLALYWPARLSQSSGPPNSFWVSFTMLFLTTGYYFLAAINGLWQFGQISEKATVALMILFDCVFWSLVVLMLWASIERVRKRPAAPAARG